MTVQQILTRHHPTAKISNGIVENIESVAEAKRLAKIVYAYTLQRPFFEVHTFANGMTKPTFFMHRPRHNEPRIAPNRDKIGQKRPPNVKI